ncbi:LIC13305 family lipoprotein [Leptospira santarosai]|uniref:LIC13305 family lipoprotein n=1 Tax=Leptospira santarosai TaxID=28183 RepID=UPI00095AF33F|nr:hypothetical protein [Leptospira santarosai]MDI7175214.1 hypothetical protein [Leptospira santarosai]MDI7194859.1 hypothetical protein [Leptospira santarosai]MDO6383695.1 hypothetical protein [Leptospira santarosai]MDO6394080.1 hypothetical protein [Leptospira santarosai]MDO6399267.1 hypothetical protein [Leptospira santarosai]
MKIRFVFFFLVLISLAACNEKKNEIDRDLLLSVALLQPPDRAENYDRDVQIITHSARGFPMTCDVDYTEEDLNFYIEILKMEIARYPRGYWIKAGVDSVLLCRNFKLLERRLGGLADIYSKTLILNVADEIGRNAQIYDDATSTFISPFEYYARLNIIHHELTHAVDFSLMGFGVSIFDPAWQQLNYTGFRYGNHYDPQNSSVNLSTFSHPLPGFITLYATTNHIEDRAEIGAGIMGTISNYNRLIQFCQSDPIISAKVKRTISEWKAFWPFPGAENSDWKIKITQAERDCG